MTDPTSPDPNALEAIRDRMRAALLEPEPDAMARLAADRVRAIAAGD